MRLGRVEVSAGCLLLLAWLNYWDTQGVVPLALAACLLHELAHYGALRLAGAGVRRVAALFRRCGCRDVTVRLYPGGRHEMLNEPEREQVMEELAVWLADRLAKP